MGDGLLDAVLEDREVALVEDVETATSVISGIGKGCELAGAALVGGETAEMPGMYEGEDYDLAGFCVGVVEKEQIIDGSKIHPGDQLIGQP